MQTIKIGEPLASPDTLTVLYTTLHFSLKTRQTASQIWFRKDDKETSVDATGCSDFFWFDNLNIGAVCARSGGLKQVWRLNIAESAWTQIADFPVDVLTASFSAKSRKLAFTAQVYSDGSLDTAAEFTAYAKENPESGVVYEELFVRHWDTYINPRTLEQLFVAHVDLDFKVSTPINVMKGTKLECPVYFS